MNEIEPLVPPKSELLELDLIRDKVKSLEEAVTAAASGDAIKEVIQEFSKQITQMDAKQNAAAACKTQMDALQSKVNRLMEVLDQEAPQRGHQELLQKIHDTDSNLYELQLSQMDMKNTQQSIQAKIASAITQMESQAQMLQGDPTAERLSRRLDVTNQELHTACGAIHEVQVAHAAVTEQLKQLCHARQPIDTGISTHAQTSRDLALLQEDVTDLRGKVHQTSDASQHQLRLVAKTVESLQESLIAQQTTVEAARSEFQSVAEDPWHGNLQAHNHANGIKQDFKLVQHLQESVKSTRGDVELLQGQMLQIAQQMDQLIASQTATHAHEPEAHEPEAESNSGTEYCAVRLVQEQLMKLTQQVNTIQQQLNHLCSDSKASNDIRDEDAIADSEATRCLKHDQVCHEPSSSVI